MVLGHAAEQPVRLAVVDTPATDAEDVGRRRRRAATVGDHDDDDVTAPTKMAQRRQQQQRHSDSRAAEGGDRGLREDGVEVDDEEYRPLYRNAILAGGLGGLTADMLMHSLDTVKTRQQGAPYRPPKYRSLGSTYWTILRQEGVLRGLYGGVIPAAVGSFVGSTLFFGAYEWSKRRLIDGGVAPSLAYLSAGIVADLAISPLYVPTEVLKTRLQLQGRYDNPHFKSGFNYRSTAGAVSTIIRSEGLAALFFGYRATLYRDLPFSAFQFAFYEEARNLAKRYAGSQDIGLHLEILTAASAGGMAGTITTPLDVVKTRIQTQVRPPQAAVGGQASIPSTVARTSPATAAAHHSTLSSNSPPARLVGAAQKRGISTSSPSTSTAKPGMTLETSSAWTGLRMIYRADGLGGLFRGVGPRAVWTSVQSGTMLVLYQQLLKLFEADRSGGGHGAGGDVD